MSSAIVPKRSRGIAVTAEHVSGAAVRISEASSIKNNAR